MTEHRADSPAVSSGLPSGARSGAHSARQQRPGARQDHPGGKHPKGQHGSNPAAWAVVAVVLAGFMVWGIGMVTGPSWTLVWIGVALVPVGLLVGTILSRLGFGATSH